MKKKQSFEDELSRQESALLDTVDRMIPLTFDHLQRYGKRKVTFIQRRLEDLEAFKDVVFSCMLVSFYNAVTFIGPGMILPTEGSQKADDTLLDNDAFHKILASSMMSTMFVYRLTLAQMDKIKSYANDLAVSMFLFAFAETVLSEENSRER